MKIFLGGTCNESKWRNRFIIMLEGVNYFNPVVDDWTEEAQERELRERKECDICLYTITPKMTGIYSIAEVVDDSNKKPDKTVLVILKSDGDKTFDNHQWKSLQATARMVKKNGSQVFDDLKSASIYLNKLGKLQQDKPSEQKKKLPKIDIIPDML